MRLFIGLRIAENVCSALCLASEAVLRATQARGVSPDRYHLTLAYLGERDPSLIGELSLMLGDVASMSSAFPLRFDGMSCFSTGRRYLVFAAISPEPLLSALCSTLRERLAQAGETFDPKPFVPHVTLGRDATMPCVPSAFPTPIPVSPVLSLTLYHSTRVEGRLCYLPIFDAPLVRADEVTARDDLA